MSRITKALIPVGGLGKRFLPQSQSMPKALLPVVTPEKRLVPIVQLQIEEALSVGIERIGLIVSTWDEPLFKAHFNSQLTDIWKTKVVDEESLHNETKKIMTISEHVDFIPQKQLEGLGHAIFKANDWIDNQPVLVILGNHLFQSYQSQTCFEQFLTKTESTNMTVLAASRQKLDQGSNRGYVSIEHDTTTLARVNKVIFSPSQETAELELRDSRYSDDKYWCLLGMALLQPDIMNVFKTMINQGIRSEGEIKLSNALEILLASTGVMTTQIDGHSIKIGTAADYLKAFNSQNCEGASKQL